MSSSAGKRRKVESNNGSGPAVSAFAALRQLRGSKNAELDGVSKDSGDMENLDGEKHPKVGHVKQLTRQGKRRQPHQSPEGNDMSDGDVSGIAKPVGSKRTAPAARSSESAPPLDNLTAQQTPRLSIVHSTFKPNRGLKNFQRRGNGSTRLGLVEGERLVILGNYGFKVCEGELSISGATLIPSEKWYHVNAPHCHALPVLRAIENSTLEIQSHPHGGNLRAMEKLHPVFCKLWNENSDLDKDSYQIIYKPEDGPKRALLRELISPAEWNKKIAEMLAFRKRIAPIIFICGPKSSGKSTFGRLVANRLVTDQAGTNIRTWPSVGILDLDPGQPEYSPPGVISLNKINEPNFSPPFCHPVFDANHIQLRAHAIASATPALDPEHFVECALDLVARYRQDSGGKYPLVINTSGWIQGTGLDILSDLVRRVQPTDVLYMSQEGPEETTDALKSACQKIPFQELPSQSNDYTSRTSLHFRTMQTMSYFHLDWVSLGTKSPTWNAEPITAVAPWRVRYRTSDRGFAGVLCYDYQPPLELLAECINGKILAIVHIQGKAALRDIMPQGTPADQSRGKMDIDDEPQPTSPRSNGEDDLFDRTPEGIPVIQNHRGRTLDPRFSRCVCLALVRGIDEQRGELHLLTPFPGEQLAKYKRDLVLVAGNFDTPSWAYTESLYNQTFEAAKTGVSDQQHLDIIEEDTDDDSSQDGNEENSEMPHQQSGIPWVESLQNNQKRAIGSKIWRVRRDLGRN